MQNNNSILENYAFNPNLAQRILCGVLCAAFGAIVISNNIATVALSCVIGILLTCMCVCDLKARIIPFELCWAYAFVSVFWVLLLRGLSSIAVSLYVAVAFVLALALIEHVAKRITGASAIGGGDRRLMPIIAFQIGAGALLEGLLAMSVLGALTALVAIIRGGSRKTYIPLAPALYACALAGSAMNLL